LPCRADCTADTADTQQLDVRLVGIGHLVGSSLCVIMSQRLTQKTWQALLARRVDFLRPDSDASLAPYPPSELWCSSSTAAGRTCPHDVSAYDTRGRFSIVFHPPDFPVYSNSFIAKIACSIGPCGQRTRNDRPCLLALRSCYFARQHLAAAFSGCVPCTKHWSLTALPPCSASLSFPAQEASVFEFFTR